MIPRTFHFRIWDPTAKTMRYPASFYACHYQIGWSTEHYVDMGYIDEHTAARPQPYTIMQETGFLTGDGQKPLFEGDIVSFAIRGATHDREPDHCAAAHIWWDQKGGQWAFGRWTQTIEWRGRSETAPAGYPRTYDWWYSASDDGFDATTLRLLGNVFERPDLVARLGYPLRGSVSPSPHA